MNILVVKLADVGDVLTATPALRALRLAHPKDRITALLSPHTKMILEGTDLVDEIVTFPKALFDKPWAVLSGSARSEAANLVSTLRSRSFDAVLLFHHLTSRIGAAKYATLTLATGAPMRAGLDNGRATFLTHRFQDYGFGALHEVEYAFAVATLLGAKGEPGSLEYAIPPDAADWAANQMAAGKPRVAIHAGSGSYSKARRWPIAGFTSIARSLQEEGADIVLVGGADEAGLTRTIAENLPRPSLDLAGVTTIPQLAAVLARSDVLIANDGGVMHLATAVGTPVVAIFGPSNQDAWGPWTAGHSYAEVVRMDLACSPCFYVGHGLGLREGCGPRPCLNALPTEPVLAAARRALNRRD